MKRWVITDLRGAVATRLAGDAERSSGSGSGLPVELRMRDGRIAGARGLAARAARRARRAASPIVIARDGVQ